MNRRAGMLVAGALVLAVAIAAAVVVLRPPVSAASQADPDVTISCAAWVGLDDAACRERGDGILRAGPPSSTFEMDDLARLELDRSWFGLGSGCTATYFIERYPDQAVFSEEVECPSP
jgi:hypothetical protein